MKIAEIRQHFDFYTQSLGFNKVERSNIISPYFNNEFNISGGHAYLMPVLHDDKKNTPQKISIRDICLRKADSDIIGVSTTHLLLFEMGIFGEFRNFNSALIAQMLADAFFCCVSQVRALAFDHRQRNAIHKQDNIWPAGLLAVAAFQNKFIANVINVILRVFQSM